MLTLYNIIQEEIYVSFEVCTTNSAVFSSHYYNGVKNLVVIYQKVLYIFSEKPHKWAFYTGAEVDDNPGKLDQEEGRYWDNAKTDIEKNYLTLEKQFDLECLKNIILDENGLPSLEFIFPK